MPDGANSAALQHATAAASSNDTRAGRKDRATAKVIYQAQSLRRAFGRRAARTFLLAKRVPSTLALRVLSLPDDQLRR